MSIFFKLVALVCDLFLFINTAVAFKRAEVKEEANSLLFVLCTLALNVLAIVV
jgi:hypothetical protein